MAKLESTLKNMILSLGIISLVASTLLAGVYILTKKPIEDSDKAKQLSAIQEVLPDKTAVVGEKVEIKLKDKEEAFVIYPATKNNQFIGCAIQTYSNEGYGGKISLMVGLDKEGNICNYMMLSSNETPGLGSKLTDWFKTKKGKQDIRGKNPEKDNFSVTKDGGDFDAITASTISSRAFLLSIKDAFEAFTQYKKTLK
ncbi:MAG: RnfABCDGE type electron transport complex subunit G [Bacteroidales bacterium]|jgi:electron transport complex protein RnfG|nr:RnfABCDGE type electron transport complex subunit G [Bacteroidales bacterium]